MRIKHRLQECMLIFQGRRKICCRRREAILLRSEIVQECTYRAKYLLTEITMIHPTIQIQKQLSCELPVANKIFI